MATTLQHHLSKRDLSDLISISCRSLACRCHDDLKQLVIGLQNVYEFDNTCYAQVDLANLFNCDISPQPVKVYNITYPEAYLIHYFNNRHYLTDSTIRNLTNKLKPINCYTPIDSCDPTERCTKAYISIIRKKHVTSANTWLHGVLDPSASTYVGFSFVGRKTKGRERVLDILKYIIPFYAEAFNRISKDEKRRDFNLTPKEIEILQWLKEGKSSWEISVILHCSKRTVDFHVENAKLKLNAVTRAQAIAIALHYGVITF